MFGTRLETGHIKMLALAVVLLMLFPPAVLEGKFSVFELSLGLLVIALLPERRQRASNMGAAVPTALVALTALMLCSVLWSAASWSTLRDATAYGVLVIAAALMATSIGLPRLIGAVVLTGSVALVSSATAALITPETAIDSWGLLQGVYSNRNGLGYVLVQALPAAVSLPLRFRGGMVVRLALVAAFVGGIVATGSKTALLTGIIVVVVWLCMLLVRWRRIAVLPLVGVGVALVAALLTNLDRVLAILGKDATVSGRTEIWQALAPVVGDRPVFGTGWTMSWPAGSPQHDAMVGAFGKPFFHAHNEILNWAVTLGVAGVVLVVSVYGFLAWAGWSVWKARVQGDSFILLTLAMLVVRGLAEISETSAQGWLILALAASAGALHITPTREVSRAVILAKKPFREVTN